jgi:hypothetical protein
MSQIGVDKKEARRYFRRSIVAATERFTDYQPRVLSAIRRMAFNAAFALALFLICAVPAYVGVPRTNEFGYDIFFFLDGGWRVLSGQRPHADFSTAWGPVTYLLTAGGLSLTGYRVEGIGFGDSLFGLILGLWAYALLHRRLSRGLAILGSVSVAALSVAPFALGTAPFRSSHAMIYNRWGYALLALVLFESFPSPEVESRRGQLAFFGGLSSGLACTLLLFLKASYFLVSLGFVIISCLFWDHSRRARMTGMILGSSLIATLMLWYLRFDLPSMLADLRMAAVSRSQSLSTVRLYSTALRNIGPTLLPTGLLALLTLLAAPEPGRRGIAGKARSSRLFLLTLAVYVAGTLLLWTNAQWNSFPLNVALALILLNRCMSSESARPYPLKIGVLFLGLFVIVPSLVIDLIGLGYAAWRSSLPPPALVLRFQSERLASLYLSESNVPQASRSNGSALTAYVNDGAELLRRCSRADERVTTFDAYDPFSYVLGRKPTRGGMAAAVYNYTFCERYHLPPEAMFGNADLVMFPKLPASDQGYFDGLVRTYGSSLEREFVRAGESSRWILYRRGRAYE